MNKKNIWIVEDEKELLELIKNNLSNEGYIVEGFINGEKMLQQLQVKKPDLILLDLMLPGINGIELCKILRREERTNNTPVVILSARSHEMDIINGFEVGADDYVTKPFNTRILSARIKSIMTREKRKTFGEELIIRLKDLLVDPNRYEVSIKNKLVPLTNSEFKILHFLLERPGQVFTRYQIVESIRGDDYMVNDRSIDVLLGRLRKKLGSYNKHIETVYGVGYRFNEDA